MYKYLLLIISSLILFADTKDLYIKDKYGNIYKTIRSSLTEKIWLDRDLGAARSCKDTFDDKCYGDYYQWGRGSDGHEKINSKTTSLVSNTKYPNHSKFILNENDWLTKQNDNLWQGVNGINNPCPNGFRVPTIEELKEEFFYHDGSNSFFKLPLSGSRLRIDGSLQVQEVVNYIWSSSVDYKKVWAIEFNVNGKEVISTNRVDGGSIRCIKN